MYSPVEIKKKPNAITGYTIDSELKTMLTSSELNINEMPKEIKEALLLLTSNNRKLRLKREVIIRPPM
jgi:hypothetical protein